MYRSMILALGILVPLAVMGNEMVSVFSDVGKDHIYRDAIEMLVGLEVINGNPDGTFAPERSVNRAEMLKMLYKAIGRESQAQYAGCFPDVVSGSWYELIVCDAAKNGFVQGYSDGTFRPANMVNRVEAIKMIAGVFGFPMKELTEEDRGVVKFVDVSVSAWYTKYLYAAFQVGILPIVGQVGPRFYPDWPLLRGESAAYIKNALAVNMADFDEKETYQKLQEDIQKQQDETQNIQMIQSSKSSQSIVQTSTFHTTFPFDEERKFDQKRPHIYRFEIKSTRTVDVSVEMSAGNAGGVTCRLYRFGVDGFSLEYYLGFQDGNRCTLLTTLAPGDYQLQLQPTVGNTSYHVVVKDGSGDGNDGFIQAKKLGSIPLVENLEANDFADWYTFTLASEKNMSVELAAQTDLGCLIYPMDDVDLYGFSGPQCNEQYLYPSGTYFVGVIKVPPKEVRNTYTIRLK